jgi:uncharacterized protein (TIGR03435 family)
MTLRRLLPIAIFALAPTMAAGPEFDVASVKINDSGSGNSGSQTHPGRLNGTNLSLKRYIQMAYGLNAFQVSGPAWIDTNRYDIDAKGPAEGGDAAFQAMLQSLLAQRFGLRLHRENKIFSGYELTIAKGGPKLKPTEGKGDASTDNGRGHLTVRNSSMARFKEVLSRQTDRPVVDRTGLPALYNFTVDWTPEEKSPEEFQNSAAPSLFTAIQEQLGLKLRAGRLPLEILVVDSAERVPTGN